MRVLGHGAVAILVALLCFGSLGLSLLELAGSPESIKNGDSALYGYVITHHAQVFSGQTSRGLWDVHFYHPLTKPLAITEAHPLASLSAYPILAWLKDLFVTEIVASVLWWFLCVLATYGIVQLSSGRLILAVMAAMAVGLSLSVRVQIVRPFFWALPLVPLAVIAVERMLSRPVALRALICGLIIGMLPWWSMHLTVMVVALAGAALLAFLVCGRAFKTRLLDYGFLSALLAAGVACYPVLIQWQGVQNSAFAKDERGVSELLGRLEFLRWLDMPMKNTQSDPSLLSGILCLGMLAILLFQYPTWKWRALGLLPFLLVIGFWGNLLAVLAAMLVVLGIARCAGLDWRIAASFLMCIFLMGVVGPMHSWGSGQLADLIPGGSAIRDPSRWLVCVPFVLALGLRRVRLFPSVVGYATIALICLVGFLQIDLHGTRAVLQDGLRIGSPIRWRPRPVDLFLKTLPIEAHIEIPISRRDGGYLPSCLIHGHDIVNGYGRYIPQTQRALMRSLHSDSRVISDGTFNTVNKMGVRCWVLNKERLRHPTALGAQLIERGLLLLYQDDTHAVLGR